MSAVHREQHTCDAFRVSGPGPGPDPGPLQGFFHDDYPEKMIKMNSAYQVKIW